MIEFYIICLLARVSENNYYRLMTETLQETLERVLAVQLKPIIIKLEILEVRMDRIEVKIDTFEKEQKKQGKAIKRLQRTLHTAIASFDREDVYLLKRVKRIDEHLGLPRLEY